MNFVCLNQMSELGWHFNKNIFETSGAYFLHFLRFQHQQRRVTSFMCKLYDVRDVHWEKQSKQEEVISNRLLVWIKRRCVVLKPRLDKDVEDSYI